MCDACHRPVPIEASSRIPPLPDFMIPSRFSVPVAARSWVLAMLMLGLALPAVARADGPLDCTLRFSMQGWSAFYKTAEGEGVVSCSNGERLPVKISSRGGGITFGKSRIDHGRGEFSGIYNIRDVLGGYAAAEKLSFHHNSKRRSFSNFRLRHFNIAVMIILHYSFRQTQTKTPTTFFRRITWFKNFSRLCFCHSGTGIFKIDKDVVVFFIHRNIQTSFSFHRINSVFHDVFNHPA